MVSQAGEDDRLDSDDTSGISTDSGGGFRNEYSTFISALDIGLSVAFQAQNQVLFDFLIDACGDLDGQCFSQIALLVVLHNSLHR